MCLLLIDISCPGSQQRCNGNGFCDLTNGVCTCDEGYQGLDCSGNNWMLIKVQFHIIILWSIFYVLELKCPADCSSAGVCDTNVGECTCDPGRHGLDCSSEIIFLSIAVIK